MFGQQVLSQRRQKTAARKAGAITLRIKIMSIWIYSKNKAGKKSVTSISFPFFLVTFFIVYVGSTITILIQYEIDPVFISCFWMIGIGFTLLFISKIFPFSKGIWSSWGMKEMPILGKVIYIAGYSFMVLGISKLIINL